MALFFIKQKSASVQTSTNEQLALQNDPQLAAEVQRMQERVDRCLGQTAEESLAEFKSSDETVTSQEAVEAMLADDIASKFPDCFFRFNTASKLQIVDEGTPDVTANLADGKLIVTATYTVKGEYNKKKYTLDEYKGSAPTDLKAVIDRAMTVRNSILNRVSGSKGNGAFTPGTEYLDENCYVDLYAYEDQGIYSDLAVNDDGTMTAYFYDYNDYLKGLTLDPPKPIKVDLPACTPANKEAT